MLGERIETYQDWPKTERKDTWNIYRAYRWDNVCMGIFIAKSAELVHAYFQGKNECPNKVELFDKRALKDHPTGVLPLINLYEKSVGGFGSSEKIMVVGKK